MARNFDTQKNKEPLYWAIGLLVLALWCAHDGWFPSESTLEKYPEFPSSTVSLGLEYEFYRFNRVTALITGIASAVMAGVFVVINRP
ncbi:hypothetical protein P0Y35_06005 [Kiritimatiellaeota bacterium B1221]|nr:hypothetical protein [Kiritimatiellaeota bacterium B1221]